MSSTSKNQRKLYLRVDAGESIGHGHLVRCLALYTEAKRFGFECMLIFKTIDETQITWLEANNFLMVHLKELEYHLKHSPYSSKNSCLIFDIEYGQTSQKEYNEVLRYFSKEIYTVGFADMVKVWSVEGVEKVYLPYVGASESVNKLKCETSTDYFVLKENYKKFLGNYQVKNEVQTVIISMGGSNPNNSIEHAVKIVAGSNFRGTLKIITGTSARINFSEIRNLVEYCDFQLDIVLNCKRFEEEVFGADIVFTNDGLTKYESIAVGVPTMTLTSFEQNVKMMELFEDKTKSVCGFGLFDPSKLKSYTQVFESFINSSNDRYNKSVSGRKIIDGNGATRVLEDINQNCYEEK